jgi:hypothetical protein
MCHVAHSFGGKLLELAENRPPAVNLPAANFVTAFTM